MTNSAHNQSFLCELLRAHNRREMNTQGVVKSPEFYFPLWIHVVVMMQEDSPINCPMT